MDKYLLPIRKPSAASLRLRATWLIQSLLPSLVTPAILNPTTRQVDEEEHQEPRQTTARPGLDGEEIRRHHHLPMPAQELLPGGFPLTLRRRFHEPNRTSGSSEPQPGRFAMKLNQLIAQYVAFRRSLGAKFEGNETVLHTFARVVGEGRHVGNVKPHQVATFLNGCGPVTRRWHNRYIVLRGFFRYAVSRGYLSASLLPATVPKLPERFKPYIYSREELRRLLDSTAFTQTRRFQMEAYTFRTLLLLLYGAGLRDGEALSLNLEDVDLQEAVLTIRDTKFYKSRLVPLGSELNDVMAEYARQRKRQGTRRL